MYDDRDNRYDDRRDSRLGPSPVCMGCEYNKMPYCFAPDNNDMRIDALPPNFICAFKSVQKQENVKKDAEYLVLISNLLEKQEKKIALINTKLNKIIKKMG